MTRNKEKFVLEPISSVAPQAECLQWKFNFGSKAAGTLLE